MGFLTDNISETGRQINESHSIILNSINTITFYKNQLINELEAIKNDGNYTQEDITELENLIALINEEIKTL